MRQYQYQILRYRHDLVTGEFINIGVVVYSFEDKFLKAQVISKYSRITTFFAGAHGKSILKAAKQFCSAIATQSRFLNELIAAPQELGQITSSILKTDDSSLILSEVQKGIDIDFERSLTELYRILVKKWQVEPEEVADSDSDIWRSKYKQYFDAYGLTNRMTTYEIDTQYDTFNFDKAWKNEVWHCYQPLSFNLKSPDSIKNKVYKWSGKIREISSLGEKLDLTFLTALPSKHQDLTAFINETLHGESDIISVNIIYDNNAEAFARQLVQDMNAHDN